MINEKNLLICQFKDKLATLIDLHKNSNRYKSEVALIGVCYLDYLSKYFCPGNYSDSERFCSLLNKHSKKKLIWATFYPSLYNKYSEKPNKKMEYFNEEDFISYDEAEIKYPSRKDLWKGTLSYFLYKEIRCIAVHKYFCDESGEIKIPVEYEHNGVWLKFKYIGNSLLDDKRGLSSQDILDEVSNFVWRLSEINENQFDFKLY